MVDEGLPIAYEVLEEGVLVYAADGEQVGTVDHVVAAPELDIFHGIVMKTGIGPRFVAADQVASLHERGVDRSRTRREPRRPFATASPASSPIPGRSSSTS